MKVAIYQGPGVPLDVAANIQTIGVQAGRAAGEAARWMLHCHHMPHLASGMMTEFAISV